jgi:NgoBV restriction endonuclease
MKSITAQELFDKILIESELVGKTGKILFSLNDFSVQINSKDSVGNLIQEWLSQWIYSNEIIFEHNSNSQKFPDIYLNTVDKTKGLLEIKVFDFDRGPGFDLANFDSYCNSLLTHAYRLDSDYLIFAYQMNGPDITIKNVWLKKIWEISGGSGGYPIKVQEKKKIIYNLRPITWYSTRNTFKPFDKIEDFLLALSNTRYQYPQTRGDNGHWLRNVLQNYKLHTGVSLEVDGIKA